MASMREKLIEHIEGKIREEKRLYPRHKYSPPLEDLIVDMKSTVEFLKSYSLFSTVPVEVSKELLRAIYEIDMNDNWNSSTFRFPMDLKHYESLVNVYKEIKNHAKNTEYFQVRVDTLMNGFLQEVEEVNRQFIENKP